MNLVFRNGTGLPEYPPDHLRLIALRKGEDELEAVQRYMSNDPTLNNYVGLREPLPRESRRFRNCWRAGEKEVAVDLPLARDQVLAEARAIRNTLLDASDKDKFRLDDIGTTEQKTALASYRQKLRDLPAAVTADLADLKSVEDLAAYQPAWPVKPDV